MLALVLICCRCLKAPLHSSPEFLQMDAHKLQQHYKTRSLGGLVSRAYSPNGQCGSANGGLLCDPDSTVYIGTCCSSYGWCGNTAAHCGTGCQSGCGTSTKAVAASGTQEPKLGSQPKPSQSSHATPGGNTTDGTCGAGNWNTVCGKWPNGACCSLYGVILQQRFLRRICY